MGRFTYVSKDREGRTVKGVLEAPDKRQALELLRGKGLLILKLEEAKAGVSFLSALKGKGGVKVKLDELVGLMICTGCDESCEVDVLRRKLEPENTQVCIAMGCRPIDERKQLPEEKLTILQEYFDQQGKSLKSKIKIVPHSMLRSIDNCYAQAIKDLDTLFTPAVKDK